MFFTFGEVKLESLNLRLNVKIPENWGTDDWTPSDMSADVQGIHAIAQYLRYVYRESSAQAVLPLSTKEGTTIAFIFAFSEDTPIPDATEKAIEVALVGLEAVKGGLSACSLTVRLVDEDAFRNITQRSFITGSPEVRLVMQEQLSALQVIEREAIPRKMMQMLDYIFAYRKPKEKAAEPVSVGTFDEEPYADQEELDEDITVEAAVSTQDGSDRQRQQVRSRREKPVGDGVDKKVALLLERLDGLAGLSEFKAYMDEVEATRHILSKWRGREDFPTQHLLFAVDPGNGCSTAIRFLHEYLQLTGLHGVRSRGNNDTLSLQEVDFSLPEEANAQQMLDSLREIEKTVSRTTQGILAIRIKDWLSKLESPYFASFLDTCWEKRSLIRFIFIVPYLEESALARVLSRLADVISVRLLHFHPYSDQELLEATKQNLREFNIEWDASSDPFFSSVLAGERSDRRFSGMRTISRLSTELVLMKVRNAALRSNEMPDNLLTGKDFETVARSVDERPGFEQLEALIGLEDVKKRVRELIVSVAAEKRYFEEGGAAEPPCFHMVFTGSPGTGKTTIARIIGKLFRENGLLRVGDLIEVNRFDLVGQYIGHTGPKTVEMCRAAMGSILFIDEAYLLATGASDRDFGREAIGALVSEMENNRDRFMVIMAGYSDEMEQMMQSNPGLRGRIPHRLHFPNYTREELYKIFEVQILGKYDCEDNVMLQAKDFFLSLEDDFLNSKEFSNARFVRNLTERIRMKTLLRLHGEGRAAGSRLQLRAVDLEGALDDEDMAGINKKVRLPRIGFLA